MAIWSGVALYVVGINVLLSTSLFEKVVDQDPDTLFVSSSTRIGVAAADNFTAFGPSCPLEVSPQHHAPWPARVAHV